MPLILFLSYTLQCFGPFWIFRDVIFQRLHFQGVHVAILEVLHIKGIDIKSHLICNGRLPYLHDTKCAWSYFSKPSFLLHLEDHHTKDVNLKFHLKRLSHFDCKLQLPISYCVSIIMVTITRHILLISSEQNAFQLWNLPWVMRKIIISFLVIPKSQKSLGKKSWKDRTGLLKLASDFQSSDHSAKCIYIYFFEINFQLKSEI